MEIVLQIYFTFLEIEIGSQELLHFFLDLPLWFALSFVLLFGILASWKEFFKATYQSFSMVFHAGILKTGHMSEGQSLHISLLLLIFKESIGVPVPFKRMGRPISLISNIIIFSVFSQAFKMWKHWTLMPIILLLNLVCSLVHQFFV